jgi:hypothetical protein
MNTPVTSGGDASTTAPAGGWLRHLRPSQTAWIWLGLMGYVALAAIIMQLFIPGALKDPAQAAWFQWPSLLVVTLWGLAGVWFDRRSGIPEAWDPKISNVQRLVIPAAIGFAAAGLQIVYDRITNFSKLNAAHYGLTTQWNGYVAALVSFSAAAIIVVGIQYLLLVGAPTYLISTRLLGGRYQTLTYWIVAVFVALIEPVSQNLWAFQAGLIAITVPGFVLSYGINLAELYTLRRAGLLAPIVLRVAFYLIWHVLYIH